MQVPWAEKNGKWVNDSMKTFKQYITEAEQRLSITEGEVVGFAKKKIDAPQDITGDDVEYAWALKHTAAPGDKISYQHNGVTIHHKDGGSTFILGGHQPLFDKDQAGKLKFKNDLSAGSRAYKLPTRSANKNNVVSLKKFDRSTQTTK